jgi:hypothetical protein
LPTENLPRLARMTANALGGIMIARLPLASIEPSASDRA